MCVCKEAVKWSHTVTRGEADLNFFFSFQFSFQFILLLLLFFFLLAYDESTPGTTLTLNCTMNILLIYILLANIFSCFGNECDQVDVVNAGKWIEIEKDCLDVQNMYKIVSERERARETTEIRECKMFCKHKSNGIANIML